MDFTSFSQQMVVITLAIQNHLFAVADQFPFAVKVIVISWMFHWSNVIRRNIQERANIKGNTGDPFGFIGLGRNLHHKMGHAVCDSLGHHLIKIQCFGGRQHCFIKGFSID